MKHVSFCMTSLGVMAKMSISCIAGVEWLLGFVCPYLAFDTIFSEDSCVSALGIFFR